MKELGFEIDSHKHPKANLCIISNILAKDCILIIFFLLLLNINITVTEERVVRNN